MKQFLDLIAKGDLQTQGKILVDTGSIDPYESIWFKTLKSALDRWFDTNEYFEVHTSGSTGKAKLISLSKKSMRESALRTARYFSLGAGSKVLLCLPPDRIAGIMMIVRALVNGWILYCQKPERAPDFNRLGDLAFSALTPMQLSSVLTLHGENSLNRVGILLLGGSSVDPHLEDRVQRLKTAVYQSYGMTETCSHVAIRSLNHTERSSHFRALDGIRFSTERNQNLIIHSSYLDLSAYHTNDQVELLSDIEFVWKGRSDFIINSGAYKINPEQLERRFSALLPDIRFVLLGEPDRLLGERLIMIIDKSSYESNLNILQTIRSSGLFHPYELPKMIYFVPELLYTETGKLRRQYLLYAKTLSL